MRRPAARTTLRSAVSRPAAKTASRPPPVKGWNTVLPLDAMEPGWATILDNWFPQPGYVELRGGHMEHSDTASALPVESLMGYHGVTTVSDKLFAASGTVIYDVTSSSPSSAVTGLSNARFQHVNFTTTGGKFLFVCNGADTPRLYDGSSWSSAAITGITASDIVHVASHKNRLWFVLVNSTKAAYLAVDTIAGAASTFELGALFTDGGYLTAINTWSRDTGAGPDDYAAFISSKGQIAVYAGTNPADATKWNIVGVYSVGSPLGRRCLTKIGADLAIISIDGVIPLSLVPGMDKAGVERIAITNNIQPTVNDAARDGQALFGWQFIGYPRGTMAVLNVPTASSSYVQYVMNTITGAWSRFTGIDAVCWEVFQDRVFLGASDGVVCEADIGKTDREAAISCSMKTAFDYFKARGQTKRWTMVRPKLTTGADITPSIALDVDFRTGDPATPSTTDVGYLATWDDSGTLWDTALWPPEQFFRNDWATITGVGYCAALRMSVMTEGAGLTKPLLRVNGFDYVWNAGGIL